MSAPLKLNDAQVEFALELAEKRRDALRKAKEFPTLAALAKELGCTERYLQKLIAKRKNRAHA